MAQTKEGLVKQKVKKILDKHNVYYFMPATGGFGRSGVPDIVACFKSKFIGIECKTVGKEVTALQDKQLKAIEAHEGMALIINEENLDYLEAILKAMEK